MAIDSSDQTPSQPATPVAAILPTEHRMVTVLTSPTPVRTATLTIPLSRPTSPTPSKPTRPEKPTLRRDSLNRREALLRGQEGSRRRQRWENDRLLSNPHAIPPTASDWEVRPLYPRRHVPYEFASLYDHPKFPHKVAAIPNHQAGEKMPKELKVRMKKTRGAIGLLKSLEEEVRKFVLGEQDEVKAREEEEKDDVVDDESDEEIVFISRRAKQFQLKTEKVLFESPVSDPGASFGRWLVHSIATYYGLKSWSITTGNPAKRIAYVGLKNDPKNSALVVKGIPKPLWLML
ncbi:hypothetical protein L873DRAFT_1815361 [Choiromyces venosus 120613-1]|uniref:R3H domain-containing protein n=1 Tax=Choiromyces venosus 120613-1 TaxID=1336337 RepID=A0A3N4J6M4_9PEZI|nr:hypothetical protein L873DRAFT_1815361 [Choiromyces venosus 120613-1]